MKFTIYDKAKWHWGAKNAPADLPQENGGTHIAFFLRWCIEHDFCSRQMKEDFAAELLSVKNGDGKTDCRRLFVLDMDGVLSTEELNTKGNQFAMAYYSTLKTKFAEAYGYYLRDYGKFVVEKLGDDDNAYYYIENSEGNYQAVKAIIDRRYAEYLASRSPKA